MFMTILLVDTLSWRWIFYVNLPIGIATLIGGLLFSGLVSDAAAAPTMAAGREGTPEPGPVRATGAPR
jgi:MFS family permease